MRVVSPIYGWLAFVPSLTDAQMEAIRTDMDTEEHCARQLRIIDEKYKAIIAKEKETLAAKLANCRERLERAQNVIADDISPKEMRSLKEQAKADFKRNGVKVDSE